jgi:hypothetical protein
MAMIRVDFSRTKEWRARYLRIVEMAERRGVPRRYAMAALDIEAVTSEPVNLRQAGRKPFSCDAPVLQQRISKIEQELIAALRECPGRGFVKRLGERVEDQGIVSARRVVDYVAVHHSTEWND